ncbi:MAG: HD domain-containing protein [Candidatus Micrarchaeota archaeon]
MGKSINDPVHGHLVLSGLQEQLIEQPEVQRLAWVLQLGLTKLVYPGANHTRLEHSLGVSTVATQIAEKLEVPEQEKNLVQAAGLLHDLGHTPFSHTLEPLFEKDHMEFTANLITGKEKAPYMGAGQIPEILEKNGLNPKDVADLVCKRYGGKKSVQKMIFGEIDADQMDYLARDAYYSGTSYGLIDIERTINVMKVLNNEMVFLEKGISSLESFLIAREHMYATVYVHHTAQIAERMLESAMKRALKEIPDFYFMTDGMLLQKLKEQGKYCSDIVDRIIYRKLFKRAYEISSLKVRNEDVQRINKLIEIGQDRIQESLCQKAGIEEGYVLVSLPAHALNVSEPRFKQTSINILRKNGEIENLYSLSSVARALSKRTGTSELFSVYCRAEDKEKVRKAAEKYLNNP